MKAHFRRTGECASPDAADANGRRCRPRGGRIGLALKPTLESRIMALDDIKKRFVDEIKLRAYDDKYVDKNEEREILQVAIAQGISIDSARSALAQVCEHQGYVLESSLLKS